MIGGIRIIRKGAFADVTIFNPRTVKNCASFKDPHRFSEGIEYVLINGKPVLDKGTYDSKALAGTVIERSQEAAQEVPSAAFGFVPEKARTQGRKVPRDSRLCWNDGNEACSSSSPLTTIVRGRCPPRYERPTRRGKDMPTIDDFICPEVGKMVRKWGEERYVPIRQQVDEDWHDNELIEPLLVGDKRSQDLAHQLRQTGGSTSGGSTSRSTGETRRSSVCGWAARDSRPWKTPVPGSIPRPPWAGPDNEKMFNLSINLLL